MFGLLMACGGSGGSAGGGSASSESYTLCDGSRDMRFGFSSEGGFVETTYQFTNPYGHSFLFIDGHCHYYASGSWLQGVVEGDLDKARADEIVKSVGLAQVEKLDYHDVESCPDAGVLWLRTAAGYLDCTCGCDAKAPKGVDQALNSAGSLKDALVDAGRPLAGSVVLIAILEEEVQSSNSPLQVWPLIWPLSNIAMTWEAFTRKIEPIEQVLSDDEAAQARMLRAQAVKGAAASGGIRASDLGKVYNLFMRDELPDEAQRAIEHLLGH
jgi:hypothetical protein